MQKVATITAPIIYYSFIGALNIVRSDIKVKTRISYEKIITKETLYDYLANVRKQAEINILIDAPNAYKY